MASQFISADEYAAGDIIARLWEMRAVFTQTVKAGRCSFCSVRGILWDDEVGGNLAAAFHEAVYGEERKWRRRQTTERGSRKYKIELLITELQLL